MVSEFAAGATVKPGLFGAAMLVMALFQLAIQPELSFRGREADFPPGNHTLGTKAREWALTEVWIGAEAAKLLIGALLASYLFAYKSRRRLQKIDDVLGDGGVRGVGGPDRGMQRDGGLHDPSPGLLLAFCPPFQAVLARHFSKPLCKLIVDKREASAYHTLRSVYTTDK